MTNYFKASALLLTLPAAACGTTVEDDLAIDNDGDHCVIKYAGETVQTKLATPCQFVKDRHGKIRSHTYHNARATVFIIMGRPSDSNPDCSEQSQWFVLGDDLLVPDHIRDIEVCSTSGGDEIAYRDAFHYIPNGKALLESIPAGEYD